MTFNKFFIKLIYFLLIGILILSLWKFIDIWGKVFKDSSAISINVNESANYDSEHPLNNNIDDLGKTFTVINKDEWNIRNNLIKVRQQNTKQPSPINKNVTVNETKKAEVATSKNETTSQIPTSSKKQIEDKVSRENTQIEQNKIKDVESVEKPKSEVKQNSKPQQKLETPPLQEMKSPYQLIAVSVMGDNSRAILVNNSNHKTFIVRFGQSIEGYTVTKIKKDSVTLLYKNKEININLTKEGNQDEPG